MASSCYVLSTLSLTCALSLAGGNTPTPHTQTPRLNQNINNKKKKRQRVELCRYSHHHRNDNLHGLILYKSICSFRKMLLTLLLKDDSRKLDYNCHSEHQQTSTVPISLFFPKFCVFHFNLFECNRGENLLFNPRRKSVI